ncbi:MAG TPA: HAD family phosphatase [Verrucomicrobiae bacterium]|nr:HAD family phosphatase [Verrucomicrobiae bacterium]
MNPVVVFDLGKVLVDFDYRLAARKIAARSTRPPRDLADFLSTSPFIVQYERGEITRRQFFEGIRQAVGFQGSLDEFSGYFADIFTEIPPMIAIHAALRARGFKTYIFSNTNDLAVEHIAGNFPFFRHFDGYVYSYRAGAMKPETKIYEVMEALCGRRGADIVYLDDRRENVEAGLARGWRAFLHETPEKTRAALEKMGMVGADNGLPPPLNELPAA